MSMLCYLRTEEYHKTPRAFHHLHCSTEEQCEDRCAYFVTFGHMKVVTQKCVLLNYQYVFETLSVPHK